MVLLPPLQSQSTTVMDQTSVVMPPLFVLLSLQRVDLALLLTIVVTLMPQSLSNLSLVLLEFVTTLLDPLLLETHAVLTLIVLLTLALVVFALESLTDKPALTLLNVLWDLSAKMDNVLPFLPLEPLATTTLTTLLLMMPVP